MSGNVTDEDETTSISHAQCKHYNAENRDEKQSKDEEEDGVIVPNISYNNSIHTSGYDTDKEDTVNILTTDNDTTLQDNINNHEGIDPYTCLPPPETDDAEEDTEGVPPLYTEDSNKGTGYGKNEDSDNKERHGTPENVSGNHNWEIENSIRNAGSPSVTASSNPMEQQDLPLSQEGCKNQ